MRIVRINAIWCNGCLVMKKIWKEVESIYPNIEVTNLDYDFDSEEVKKYDVGDILPVTIFYDNDKEIKRLIGEKTTSDIINVIEGKSD